MCVLQQVPSGEYIYLLLYVDDMLIASRSRSAIDSLKKTLSSEFEMKDLGEAKKYWVWRSQGTGKLAGLA